MYKAAGKHVCIQELIIKKFTVYFALHYERKQ
jgi:hypothetical protein